MDIIQLDDAFPVARGCRIELLTFDAVSASVPAGSAQTRAYGVPRWSLSLVSPSVMNDARAGRWKALQLKLRGSLNRVAACDPGRPVPLGTLRGNLTLAAPIAIGDVTAQITGGAGQAGRTVVIGDMFGFGAGFGTSQLVCAVEDGVADGAGAMTLRFEAPARRAFPTGTVVTWQRPRAYFLQPQPRAGWGAYSRTRTEQMSIDLVEDTAA